MNLIPVSIVVVALVGVAAALGLAGIEPWLLRSLAAIEPRRRTQWLLGLLAAPLALGGTALLLALGHCAVPRILGLPDDCDGVGGAGCAFCIFREGQAGALAWGLALGCAAPLALSVARAGVGIARARRARRRMESVARRRADGVLLVPGTGAFVVGWPNAAVFLGEDLSRALSPEGVVAVTAHEREHLRRGDVALRSVARVLSVLHLGPIRARLLAALDVAMEQACDARASAEVSDPLIVAQALLDTAHLHAASDGTAGCVGASLPARISALCEPSPRTAPIPFAGPLAVAGLVGLVAIAFDHEVHGVAELVSFVISR